ncbi:MAG TPA: hypothetical protein VIX14_12685 [Terriglobales bacterium]
MATKKSAKKSSPKAKKTARKKPTPQETVKRPKNLAKKKPVPKTAKKKKASGRKQTQKKSERLGVVFSPAGPGLHSGEQSGDLQGLSRFEAADSESVDELIEEGNAFEAGVVAGVESADNADEKEVRTHEVPEDDVPGEYLNKE